jgi:hypothetical protein
MMGTIKKQTTSEQVGACSEVEDATAFFRFLDSCAGYLEAVDPPLLWK